MEFPWGIREAIDECWGRREETRIVSFKKSEWLWSRQMNLMQELIRK
jgi:hypothetical protein